MASAGYTPAQWEEITKKGAARFKKTAVTIRAFKAQFDPEVRIAVVAGVVAFVCLVVGASTVNSPSSVASFAIAAIIAAIIGYWRWNLESRRLAFWDGIWNRDISLL